MTTRAAIPVEPSDAALIHRFLDGDERAFRALYARHTPRLKMIVVRLLGTRRDETDDVLQETWLAGCRGLHRYNGSAPFASWLTTIGVRAAYARYARWPQADAESFDQIAAPDTGEPASTIDLERAIACLPVHQRAVVVLHDVEGFTHEEIGVQLGIAAGTSKATLSRARHVLRRLLHEGAPHGY